jgi:hypothetical protein
LNRIARALLAALCLALATAVGAQDRQVVTVSFKLDVPRWQRDLGSSVPDFEMKAAHTIATWLGSTFGFMRFKPGSADTRHLSVRLAVSPGSEGGMFSETELVFSLIGHGDTRPIRWSFRIGRLFAEPTHGPDPFAAEVLVRMGDLDRPRFIDEFLSKVPISDRAKVWRDPIGWVLPYRRAELCMDYQSVVVVEHLMDTAVGPIPKPFNATTVTDFTPRNATEDTRPWTGNMFAQPVRDQADLFVFSQPGANAPAIRAVYVKSYRALQPCAVPVPPSEAGFR